MINKSFRLKIFILPLSAVVVLVMVIFYVKPMLTEMLDAKQALSDSRQQLDSVKVRNQKLQKIKGDWQALGEEKSRVETALPETENVDVYVAEILSKANLSGILVSGVDFGSTNSVAARPAFACNPDAEQAAGASAVFPSDAAVQSAAANGESTAMSSAAPLTCSEITSSKISIKGTWEQTLEFLKYLEDMNRLSNINEMSISGESQESSDLLATGITINGFFKEKEKIGNQLLAGSLADQNGFNKKTIEKLNEVIYSLYSTPTISETGERNMFK